MAYTTTKVQKDVYILEDEGDNTCYLIVGKKRAVLIDTGMGLESPLKEIIKITKLPVSLLLTHTHIDHSFYMNQFEKVWVSEKETPFPDKKSIENELIYVMDKQKLFLDENIILEVLEVEGHTMGSVSYLDKKRGLVFVGDMIGGGCGVWMQMPTSSTVEKYYESLRKFYNRILEMGNEPLFMTGHRKQQFGYPQGSRNNPVNMEMIKDMLELCTLILRGKSLFDEFPIKYIVGEEAVITKNRKAEMVLRKDRIFKGEN